jgi:hypothetical protein
MNAFVVIGVIAAFKAIPEKQLAAVAASSLFLMSASVILFFERKHASYKKRFSFWMALAFLVLSILPIALLRFTNWGVEFSSLDLFGIPAQSLHRFSNWMFMGLMVALFIDSQVQARRDYEAANPHP